MNTIDEAIEILQAMKEGKTIQIKLGGEWKERKAAIANTLPNFPSYNYRVKTEPVDDWVIEWQSSDHKTWCFWGLYHSYTQGFIDRELERVGQKCPGLILRARKLEPVS